MSLSVLLPLLFSGCNGGNEPRGDARKGGSITIGASELPRVLDPALATDLRALQVLRAVYTAPLTYRHIEGHDGTNLMPGLARERPEVSDDGLVYSFRLRAGLRYSNGTRVRATDFERAVDRTIRMESPHADLYDAVADIETDDGSGRVVVRLARPDSAFEQTLALSASAPVPAGTRAVDLSDRPPPGIGPYAFSSVRPGERLVLSRVRDFELPDLPDGNVDQITIERFATAAQQAEAVATGATLDLMQELPPTARLPEIRSEYADRYAEETTASTLFFAIDTSTPPFEDERVRQAVSLSVDGPTLERLYAGRVDPGCNLLPPAVPGYRRLDPCPYGSRSDPPDLVRARQLVEEAGQDGAVVTVTDRTDDAPLAVLRYFVRTLRKIGLAASQARQPAAAAIALESIESPVAHPAAFLSPFRGRTGGFELEAEIERLVAEPQLEEDEWAQLDERLVEEAIAAPLGAKQVPVFFSERIDVSGCAIFHPFFGIDFANLCLR